MPAWICVMKCKKKSAHMRFVFQVRFNLCFYG